MAQEFDQLARQRPAQPWSFRALIFCGISQAGGEARLKASEGSQQATGTGLTALIALFHGRLMNGGRVRQSQNNAGVTPGSILIQLSLAGDVPVLAPSTPTYAQRSP